MNTNWHQSHGRGAKDERSHHQILLPQALSYIGWAGKFTRYTEVFEYVDRVRPVADPPASAIVISHRLHPDTLECLRILKASAAGRCEVIFVSNGVASGELAAVREVVDIYVHLNQNTGAYIARNIGAVFAAAPVLVFVEDDCVPYANLMEAHVEAHERFDCISVRGVYEPKTDNPLNALAAHYDLGHSVFPQYVVAEGNASYHSEIFYKVGGWDDEIRFGGAGADLALRLLEIEPDMRRQMYFPKARIRHDYAVDEAHLERKRRLQKQSFLRLQGKHPEYRMARWVYRKYLPRAERDCPDETRADPAFPLSPRLTAVTPAEPRLSVIIMASSPGAISTSLRAIERQRVTESEVIFLVRGKCTPGDWPDWATLITVGEAGEAAARATAVRHARGEILLFADTDTRLTGAVMRAHLQLYREFDLLAVQGAVVAPEGGRDAGHAWYPPCEFPAFANLPVNLSYRRDALLRAGGWPTRPAQGAGVRIAIRLCGIEPDFRKQIFSPRPVVAWDVLSRSVEGGAPREPPDVHCAAWDDLLMLSRRLFGVGGMIPPRDSAAERKGREILDRFMGEHDFSQAVGYLKELVGYHPARAFCDFRLRLWSILDLAKIVRDRRDKPMGNGDPEQLFQYYKSSDPVWFMPDGGDRGMDCLTLGPDRVGSEFVGKLLQGAALNG